MSNGEIKIKVLPRSNEGATKPGNQPLPKRTILYVTVSAVALLLLAAAFFSSKKVPVKVAKTAPRGAGKNAGHSDMSSIDGRINELVTRHLQETEIQREMMMRRREIENQAFKNAVNEPNSDDIEQLPEQKNMGVSFDTDDAAKRVYEDTHDDPGTAQAAELPGDKITARLANRKWMNEMERAERIEFISNFIRSAYDRGYEVDIDSNLVVVGVRPINHNKLLNIDQVIDRLAKGQEVTVPGR